ncbi:MAG: DUF4386 domain-containing protein [Ilumatobacteraceae bacterium]
MIAPTAPAPLATSTTHTTQALEVRRAARTAGAAILVLAVLSGFGVLIATRGLVTDGDAARTADDIAKSQSLFRAGTVSLCFVVVLDVVAAAALYRMLRPANETLSRIVAWLRVTYAAGFLVAIAQLFGAVSLAGGGAPAAGLALRDVGVLSHMQAFDDAWQAALLVFGIHLLLLGYLTYRSGYVPRAVGALVAVAGVGYAFDSVVSILTSDVSNVSGVTFIGEAVLAVWLVLRGSRIEFSDAL